MSHPIQVTFDCADPAALSEFWAEALGYRLQDPPEGFESWTAALEALGVPPERHNDASALVDPAGSGPRIFFQRVPEGKTVKNRVHVDIRAAPPDASGEDRMVALEQACERLVRLGATRIERREPDPPLQWGHLVMADPEGNEFCLD